MTRPAAAELDKSVKAPTSPGTARKVIPAPQEETFVRLSFQSRDVGRDTGGEEGQEYQVQLQPPGPQRLFRLESEARLQERIRQEAKGRAEQHSIVFPDEPVLDKGTYVARRFPERKMLVEPNYVCYSRLYFEEKNSERYGWDVGILQPFLSASAFFWDAATLPNKMWTDPCRHYECNAGECLPGDPVPYLLYPPELSVTGTFMQAGTAVGLFAIFPP